MLYLQLVKVGERETDVKVEVRTPTTSERGEGVFQDTSAYREVEVNDLVKFERD